MLLLDKKDGDWYKIVTTVSMIVSKISINLSIGYLVPRYLRGPIPYKKVKEYQV